MRLVLDTNIVVSGLIWNGPPARLIDLAASGEVELVASHGLIAEFQRVVTRRKFETVLKGCNLTADELLTSYLTLCDLVEPAPIPPTVLRDPDDDAVLAAAVAGKADMIVTGDLDLLDIGAFRTIPILRAAQAVSMIEGREAT